MLRDLSLRPLAPRDEAALADVLAANDVPEVTRWFDPFPLSAASAHMLTHHRGRDLYWGVWSGSDLVGLAMVRGWDQGHPQPAYGCLIDRSRNGLGLATAATGLVLDELRSAGVTQVRARVHADNDASLRMLTSNGFSEIERAGGRVLLEAWPAAGR